VGRDQPRIRRPIGLPEAQHWYVGSKEAGTTTAPDSANQIIEDVTLAAGAGYPERLLRMQVEKTMQASPESLPATTNAIPSMGLIPVPDYMVTAAPNGEIDKFDLNIMYTEVKILAAMAATLNGLSPSRSPASRRCLRPFEVNTVPGIPDSTVAMLMASTELDRSA
jgi:hypothetical protein